MKVAVCISGQTRDFNKNKEIILNDLESLFGDHEYDLYGHTWSDCEKPDDMSIFKVFAQTDQNIISDWVKEDIQTFGTFYDWNDMPEYVEILNKDTGYLQFICDRSKGRLGQTLSAHECFKLVPHNSYDIIVRYRWDILINYDIYMYGSDRVLSDFKIAIEHFLSSGCDIAVPTHLRFCYGSTGNITVPDLFFVMTKSCHSIVVDADIKKIYRKINQNNLSSHSLWGEVLAHYTNRIDEDIGKVVSLLPNVWECIGGNYIKENHKWKL